VIPGVIVAAAEVNPHIGPVIEGRIAAPLDSVVVGQGTRSLGFEEEKRLLQSLAVVDRARKLRTGG
jgi:hypothetical protein